MIAITETRDFALCRQLRRIVFIEEQGVSEADEVDDQDDVAIHLLAQEGEVALGSARLLVLGDVGKVGRVCVVQAARGRGIGQMLMRAAVDRFRHVEGVKKVKLGAQTHAIGFYAALGFAPVGDVYLDAGIDHQDMVLVL